MAELTIDNVKAATEQEIINRAYLVATKLSLVQSKVNINEGAALCRLLRVMENGTENIDFEGLQLVMQDCISIGNLKI